MKNFLRLSVIFMLTLTFCFLCGCTSGGASTASVLISDSPAPSESILPSDTAIVSEGYYVVSKNGRKGVVNERGQTVLPFEYCEINILYYGEKPFAFSALPAVVKISGQKSTGSFGFFCEGLLYSLNGSAIYNDNCYASPLNDSLIVIYAAEKCGAITCGGKEVIPFQYTSISLCGNHIIAASGDFSSVLDKTSVVDIYDLNGVLQKSGKLSFVGASDNLLIVTNDTGTKFGLTNIDFKEIVPAEWDELNYVGSELFIARRGDKYGIIDGYGKEIVPVKFSYIDRCYNTGDPASVMFTASSGSGVYLFDQSGKQLFFSNKFNYVYVNNGIMIAQEESGRSHYINEKGEDVIPPASNIYTDSSGFIISYNNQDCICYTKDGEKLPLPEAQSIGSVSPDRFIFLTETTWLYGICDENGGIIVPAKYTYMYSCGEKNSFAVFTETDNLSKAHYGVLDVNDGSILLSGFDELSYASGGLFYASKGIAHGLVDTSGNWIWQTTDYQTLMD